MQKFRVIIDVTVKDGHMEAELAYRKLILAFLSFMRQCTTASVLEILKVEKLPGRNNEAELSGQPQRTSYR